jgi:large subunit ribosomal protein L4
MPTVELLNDQGQPSGSLELNDKVFGNKGKTGVVHQAMVQELANKRQGTASVKTRADVRGGGRKPWRQKGTGRARHGSTRSPIWTHGGVAHGPHPRSYRIEMPRKQKRVAMQRALSARLADGEVMAVETIALAEAKTKLMVGYLRGLGIDESATKLLILTGEGERDTVLRASNNLPKVRTRVAPNVAIVDVLWADRILCTSGALKTLEETLGR